MCKLILEQVSLKWLHLPFLLGARQGSEKQDSFRFDWGSTCQDHIKQMEEVKTKQDLLIDSMNEDIKRLTERKAQWDSWKLSVWSYSGFCTRELWQQFNVTSCYTLRYLILVPKNMVLLFPQSCKKMGLSWPRKRIVAAGVGQGKFLKMMTVVVYTMLNFRCVPLHKRLDVEGQKRWNKCSIFSTTDRS